MVVIIHISHNLLLNISCSLNLVNKNRFYSSLYNLWQNDWFSASDNTLIR